MHNPSQRLVASFDCTREYAPEQYYACGAVTVVTGSAGCYREAEANPLSRFGYRFQIEHIGQPHLVVIRYPDDKRRFIVINDGTSCDLSTGITTGWAQPLSHTMQEIRQVFWPRWTDCSINFMTWGHDEPVAAASIEIYELDDLPALKVPSDPRDGTRRAFGMQYEDPCGTGSSEGSMFFEQWLDRVTTYAHHTGQTLLSYPICWYHGPCVPSEHEPSNCFSTVIAEDRRMYIAWTASPPDWPAVLLERFGCEGLQFQGVLTLLRLGSLMQQMNVDLPAIQAGAETFNNMLWNDRVQAGTMDWTGIYNVRNFSEMVSSGLGADALEKKDFPLAYGEAHPYPYPPGPMFNPIHPVVQDALVSYIREIGQRYGHFPAFQGIAITMWAPTLLWFGSIHSGYDDYTISRFEAETGIHVHVDPTAPNRFSQRYAYLTYACRPAWVDWRCQKIRDLIRAIRDALTESRSDLRLTLNLWSEPYVPAILGNGAAQHQLYARPGMHELWRDARLDLALFRDEPNIDFDLQTEGGQRDRSPSSEKDRPIEAFCMFRDHDYLDQATLDAVHDTAKPGVFIFNAWHEAWGKHRWFACDPDDDQAAQLAMTYGQPAEGIFRINSEYPDDGFWWSSQLRITHAFQPGVHFMEQYAHAVAELDACRITRGGLYLDKAHGEELRAFAAAFRALPARKFTTVSPSTDPAAMRTLVDDGQRYFYLQNRDYYPVTVTIDFSAMPRELTELSDGSAIAAGTTWQFELGPYALRSFRMASEVDILTFIAVPPADIASATIQAAEDALEWIDAVMNAGQYVAGMDRLAERIRQAIIEKRYAWLRRALTSYIVRKCEEISKGVSLSTAV